MIIRRLDVFFRTHLTLDSHRVFNDVTNFLFIPIQYVFGQNKYQSLQGKVTEVPKKPDQAAPSTTLTKIAKVFLCFVAIIPTILGIVTRHLSFLSPDVNQAYTIAFLSQLTPFDLTPQIVEASFAFLLKKPAEERHQLLESFPDRITTMFLSLPAHQNDTNAFLLSLDEAPRRASLAKLPPAIQSAFLLLEENQDFSLRYLEGLHENDLTQLAPFLTPDLLGTVLANRSKKAELASVTPKKIEPIDALLSRAIESLEELKQKLYAEGDLSKKLQDYRNTPFYPFPFLLAESHPETPDNHLWSQLKTLCGSCSEILTASGMKWDEKQFQETARTDAITLILTTVKTNRAFFNQLDTMLTTETPDQVITWLGEQQKQPEYTYPFHTQPLILTFWNKLKPNPKTAELLGQIDCHKSLLEQKMIPIEEPPSDHLTISRLQHSMDQLENIANFQALVAPKLTS